MCLGSTMYKYEPNCMPTLTKAAIHNFKRVEARGGTKPKTLSLLKKVVAAEVFIHSQCDVIEIFKSV